MVVPKAAVKAVRTTKHAAEQYIYRFDQYASLAEANSALINLFQSSRRLRPDELALIRWRGGYKLRKDGKGAVHWINEQAKIVFVVEDGAILTCYGTGRLEPTKPKSEPIVLQIKQKQIHASRKQFKEADEQDRMTLEQAKSLREAHLSGKIVRVAGTKVVILERYDGTLLAVIKNRNDRMPLELTKHKFDDFTVLDT